MWFWCFTPSSCDLLHQSFRAPELCCLNTCETGLPAAFLYSSLDFCLCIRVYLQRSFSSPPCFLLSTPIGSTSIDNSLLSPELLPHLCFGELSQHLVRSPTPGIAVTFIRRVTSLLVAPYPQPGARLQVAPRTLSALALAFSYVVSPTLTPIPNTSRLPSQQTPFLYWEWIYAATPGDLSTLHHCPVHVPRCGPRRGGRWVAECLAISLRSLLPQS